MTETLSPATQNLDGNSAAGIAIGIALATVIFAGLLTWIRFRLPS
jgi:hypothetical protein